ncbi:MAG TPA: TIGR03067 domain-containing protein [Promineifilum sp.]|mgnify:CR=1 FL=1|nr:TIGR03067 domain-containing protein [Promineifilum sp.]
MFRIVVFIALLLVCVSAVFGQSGKQYQIAVGQTYRAGNQGGAWVAADAKQLAIYAEARSKQDDKVITGQLKSGGMLIVPQNSKLEILKIEPKSAENPHGLVECKRTSGVIKDGQIEQVVTTVYMIPELFCQLFVDPADEATKAAALPEDKPIFRTWKAATGGFEVAAEFLRVDAGKVALKRTKDEKEISVPLDQLSAGDRKWLTDMAKESQLLLGKWQLESVEAQGNAMPLPPGEEISITFMKDKHIMKAPGAPMPLEGTWKINHETSPKQIDLIDTTGQGMGGLGVYELKGDVLKICAGRPGTKDRPTAFSTKLYLGEYEMMTLKRKK